MIRRAVAPAYLLACLLLGGASAAGFVANLVLQLAALPLIGWALWHVVQHRPTPPMRAPLALLAAMVAIALVELIPLPPAVWTRLPGRAAVVEGYRLLGIPLPSLPLTLAPDAALASLLWLLPAFATLLAVLVLGAFRGRWLAAVIVAVTLIAVAIGALQVIGGESSYFYAVTNYGVAVGFFANANHNATLLLVAVPFLAALASSLLTRGAPPRSASAIRLLIGAAYAVIAVGLLINGSLAGIGLGVPVALATWLTFGRQPRALRRGLAIVAVLATAAAVGTVAIAPGNNLFGQQHENVELSRQTSFALTLRAAREYLPVGSGIGTFQPVYRTQEPLATIGTTYMNHAHSDWLELLLETGVIGIAYAAAFLAWWGLRARAVWRAEEPDPFARAAVIATAAIMLHSIVDYPLRTAALSAVFAACLALMAGARAHVRRNRTLPSARHLTL